MGNTSLKPLCFNFHAINQLELKGVSFEQEKTESATIFDVMKKMGTMYWAGRLAETPELTEAEASAELSRFTFAEVTTHVNAAMREAMGTKDEPVDDNPKT